MFNWFGECVCVCVCVDLCIELWALGSRRQLRLLLQSFSPNWILDPTLVELPPKVAHLYFKGHDRHGPCQGNFWRPCTGMSCLGLEFKVRPWERSHTFSTCGGIPFAGNRKWFQILHPNSASYFELSRPINHYWGSEIVTDFPHWEFRDWFLKQFWSSRMRSAPNNKEKLRLRGRLSGPASLLPAPTDYIWFILRTLEEIPQSPQIRCSIWKPLHWRIFLCK